MKVFDLFQGGKYLYTLGMNEDPEEVLEAEQSAGRKRLVVTELVKGRRVPFLTSVDETPEEEDFFFEEEEEEELD